MLKKPKRIKIRDDRDIVRVVEGLIADRTTRILERDGKTVAVLLSPEDYDALRQEPDDPWGEYEPARARAAFAKSSGLLAGVDRAALLRDLHQARGQGSDGRPG